MRNKSISIKGLSRRKGSKDQAPITKKSFMAVLGIFFLFALLLTLAPVASAFSRITGFDMGLVQKWADRLAGISGGVIMVVLGLSLATVPIISGAFIVSGLLLIGIQARAIMNEQQNILM